MKISVWGGRLGSGTLSLFPGGQKGYGNVCRALVRPHVLQWLGTRQLAYRCSGSNVGSLLSLSFCAWNDFNMPLVLEETLQALPVGQAVCLWMEILETGVAVLFSSLRESLLWVVTRTVSCCFPLLCIRIEEGKFKVKMSQKVAIFSNVVPVSKVHPYGWGIWIIKKKP